MDPNGRTGPGPKVFGIGLSRTGTKSLAGALNLLGIRTKWYPQDPQTYRELLMGEYRLSILKTYQAKRWGQRSDAKRWGQAMGSDLNGTVAWYQRTYDDHRTC